MARRRAAVQVIELCRDRLFYATNGTGRMFVVSDELRIGPDVRDIVIHAVGSDFEADFGYVVGLNYRMFDDSFSPYEQLLAEPDTSPIETADYQISSPFTDRTKLGLGIRFVVGTVLVNSQTATKTGRLTVSAALRYFT